MNRLYYSGHSTPSEHIQWWGKLDQAQVLPHSKTKDVTEIDVMEIEDFASARCTSEEFKTMGSHPQYKSVLITLSKLGSWKVSEPLPAHIAYQLLRMFLLDGRMKEDENIISAITKLAMSATQVNKSVSPILARSILNSDRFSSCSLDDIQHILDLCIEYHSNMQVKPRGVLFSKGKLPAEEFLKKLQNIQLQDKATKFPEKPIEHVMDAFHKVAQRNGDVDSVPLLPTEISRVKNIYQSIDEQKMPLTKLSDAELKLNIARTIRQLKNCGQELDFLVERLALAREVVHRTFGIMPYNTQMFSVIAIVTHEPAVKGRIAQVNTGEGKSTLVSLLGGFYAMQGRTVDIISSSSSLAKRDAEKYAAYYEFFGLSSGHICVSNPTQEYFQPQILFGTNTDFEFSILRDFINKDKVRLSKVAGASRECDVVLVDEVDNLFIDKGQSSAIIALPGVDHQLPLARVIFKVMSSNVKDLLELSADNAIEKVKNYCLSSQGDLEKIYLDTDQTLVRSWIENCKSALYERKENVDYVVRKPDNRKNDNDGLSEIIIIEQVTGQLQEGSRWQNRLHQFLELKHGLLVKPESHTAAELSHPVFFKQYKKLIGLTGTIGSREERLEINEVYEVDTFDVPPHKPCLRVTKNPLAVVNDEQHHALICSEIQDVIDVGQPVLVLMETIEKCRTLSNFLRKHEVMHQVYDATQFEDEEHLISRAGQPGIVTLATNMAGRGTDIKVSTLSLKNGGLHVILGFFPDSKRVESQGVGRAARQGQPGSSRNIVNLKDVNSRLLQNLDVDNIYDSLEQNRRIISKTESEHRKVRGQIASTNFSMLRRFCSLLESWRGQITTSAIGEITKQLHLQLMKKNYTPITELSMNPKVERLRYAVNKIIDLMRGSDFSELHTNKKTIEAWVAAYIDFFEQHLVNQWAIFFSDINQHQELNAESSKENKILVEKYSEHSSKAFEYFRMYILTHFLTNPVKRIPESILLIASGRDLPAPNRYSMFTK